MPPSGLSLCLFSCALIGLSSLGHGMDYVTLNLNEHHIQVMHLLVPFF